MDIKKIQQYVDSLGVKCWLGVIPASEKLPATSLSHITDGYDRLLDGVKTNRYEMWRLTVTGNNAVDVSGFADIIRAADNTNGGDYQKILIDNESLITPDEGDSILRVAIDLKVY